MADASAPAGVPGQTGRRIVLLLEYDGGRFAGSQLQKNALTVQAVLEQAIERATSASSRAAFAGRTDAGTHARGQVASFVTESRLGPETLVRALNAWLPEDVVVRAAAEAHADLDVRRHANRRSYRYVIRTGSVRPALDRRRAWYVSGDLDVAAMNEAASRLLGVHDFAAFAGPMERADASTVRHLYCLTVRRQGDDVILDAEASSFLPHQVRRFAGALVEVGRGRLSVDSFEKLLQGPPASAGPVAPAHGLCLMRVDYESPLFGEGLASSPAVC
ncbi:MAG: tRNA pseudouridine(38-40) synthase TruA [Dehalococcoidia bacterium]